MTQVAAANQFKSMSYDHPAYVGRGTFAQAVVAAGASSTSAKFVAYTNILLFSINSTVTAAGTSTATATVNGTATVHINSQPLSLVVITNTAGTGVAPALSTSTIGPLYQDQLYANGTYTGGIGAFASLPLNTATGVAGLGGLLVPQGSQVYVVSGTDATAASIITIDSGLQPLAAVTA